jgi:hypothetical protein
MFDPACLQLLQSPRLQKLQALFDPVGQAARTGPVF